MTFINFENLERNGIKRDRLKYFLNITYPSLQIMDSINESKVFEYQTDKRKKISLYVNIPFCSGKCTYCHYFTLTNPPEKLIDKYIEILKKEISLYKKYVDFEKVSSLYIGGGTPTILSDSQLKNLFENIKSEINIPESIEKTIEIHPTSIDEKKLDVLLDNRITRVNIGIDDFDENLMKVMNRRHNLADAYKAFNLCRNKGIGYINIDLIRGIPGQNKKIWKNNLEHIEKLKPESFTSYYLRLKEGTKLYYTYKKDPLSFPSDSELLEMNEITVDWARKNCYKQDMADWFVKDSFPVHQYQYDTWCFPEETELIGLGAASYSYLNNSQYYNLNDLDMYLAKIENDELAIWRGQRLGFKERMCRCIVLGIRAGINRNYFKKHFKREIYEVFERTIKKLEILGLAEYTHKELKLTEKGKLFADEVGREFYSKTIKDKMKKIEPSLISTTYRQFNR